MEFWNKNRKIFAGILLGGIGVYIIYRKYGSSAPAATTNFTGNYKPFTGPVFAYSDGHKDGCDCCPECAAAGK